MLIPLLFLALALTGGTPETGKSKEEAPREPLSVLWKRAVSTPASLTVAPGGAFFGVVGKNEEVRVYDVNGSTAWRKKVEGATDVLIANNGSSLLVFSELNPRQLGVRFYRNDGTLLWNHRVDGAVWAGAVSADGAHAAVSTGKQYMYLYTPDPLRPRYRRWRLNGIGHSLAFTPDSKKIVIGTWQESSLVSYDLQGSFLWRYKHNTEHQYNLQVSTNGQRILGVRPGSQHTPNAEIALWDSRGKLLWQHKLKGFDTVARISPQSRYVAVSYANYLTHKKSNVLERKIAVYSTSGKLLWAKGGLFFSPRLIALSPTGASVIVSDGERSFYNIDSRGSILSKVKLNGTIRRAKPSDDGRHILVYCGDGWLYLIGVSA